MIKSQIISILDNYPVIALAVSGGSDSMAMLEWFRQNRPKNSFFIVNIDHHIRGEESKRDSDFVRDYAKKYDIKFEKYDVDAVVFAREKGYTLEQAARILRHKIFEQVTFEKANVIATAHHASDQAESVLMHIARGTGIGGLKGMSVQDGHIIRPLLQTRKQEIMGFLANNNVSYCTDSTNSDNDYSRNYIRNVVLKSIEQKYPNFEQSLIKLSDRAKEIADFIDINTPPLYMQYGGIYCKLEDKHSVICAEMIRRAFSLLGITFDIEQRHINSIINFAKNNTSGSIDMPYNTVVYKENKGIVIAKKTVYPNETYRFSDGFFEIGGFELQVQRVQYQDCLTKNASQFDLEKALFIAVDKTEELVVRLRNSGDTIQKFGGGSKSLGDFLTDKKVPLRLRDRLPVIANGNEIICVCGVDIARSAKVEKDSKIIYKITLASD